MAGMPGIPAGMIGGPMTNQAGQYAVPPNVPGVYLGGQSTTTVASPAVKAQSAAATNDASGGFLKDCSNGHNAQGMQLDQGLKRLVKL